MLDYSKAIAKKAPSGTKVTNVPQTSPQRDSDPGSHGVSTPRCARTTQRYGRCSEQTEDAAKHLGLVPTYQLLTPKVYAISCVAKSTKEYHKSVSDPRVGV
jgi:hypothetical protein